MIELFLREMKNLSRILTMMLCFAPLCVNAAGNVATPAGNNLTAFNPSNANNNQWATLSNGRYDTNTTAKADFANCEAVISRCAKPKCSNGGCADMSVAMGIVSGCVQSNEKCKQYGDALIQSMSAQLVASSNAKINEQNAAAQQAAAVAAQQAAQQSAAQMQQMQQQMQEMQQQMAQQQAESQQQLQAALAQQQAQSQQALEDMKSAATAAAMETESGVSAYQQDAINRGISADVLERQKITGQIMTEIENAEVSLKEVKTAMNTAFEYAGCDPRGNSCAGPKRVKKWRELARDFTDPYDNTINKIYDALVVAQTVGVDLSQIYMMLNNSCNSWGQYMCPQMPDGQIVYTNTSEGQKGTPRVCAGAGTTRMEVDPTCLVNCMKKYQAGGGKTADDIEMYKNNCNVECMGVIGSNSNCQDCTLLKVLTSENDVYEGWINAEKDTTSANTTVVACASGALDGAKLFTRRTRNKNGANLVDMDMLELWLDQNGVDKQYSSNSESPVDYCYCTSCGGLSGSVSDILRKSSLSKSVDTSKMYCSDIVGGRCKSVNLGTADAAFINPAYAICDTHPYNAGKGFATQEIRDPTNCTKWAKDQKTYENPTHIQWAKKDENDTETPYKTCKIEHCSAGYKPDRDKGCIELSEGDVEYEYYKSGGKYFEDKNKEWQRSENPEVAETKEVVGLKVTVISQQMYKQYEYLNATLRRLKIQLEKAVLTASLQAAGAKSEDGSSSSSSGGLVGGGSSNDDKTIHLAGANNCSNFMDYDSAYTCLQTNVSLIKSNVGSNTKKACLQLQSTVVAATNILGAIDAVGENGACKDYNVTDNKSCKNSNKSAITSCADAINFAVMKEKRDQAQKSRRAD